jgi:hypothetical protein
VGRRNVGVLWCKRVDGKVGERCRWEGLCGWRVLSFRTLCSLGCCVAELSGRGFMARVVRTGGVPGGDARC